MHPVSELVLRNLSRLSVDDALLLVNPPADGLAAALAAHVPALRCSTRHHGVARSLQPAAGATFAVRFEAWPGDAHRGPVVLLAPREKELLAMQADALRPCMEDHPLWIAGEKRAGIRSAVRRLEPLFERIELRDTARHGALFEARCPRAGAFDPGRHRREWALPPAFGSLPIVSWPGVFAHGDLDQGSQLLLEALAGMELRGRVLDFACGAGVIGTVLKHAQPALDLELCDHDALALQATAETLAVNGLEARVTASDGLGEVTGRFDWIVSNPPFHLGVRTDLSITERFIRDAHQRLVPGGRLVLVANRHLPYRRCLDDAFGTHRVVAGDDRFVVLAAARTGP